MRASRSALKLIGVGAAVVAVRQLREMKGWSQERLAAEARLHATYLSGVERSKRNISLENIAKLAKALEVPIAALFDDP
jgi:transcriptional regulator with XRE-family HTH domain